jgi:hypothetical protein
VFVGVGAYNLPKKVAFFKPFSTLRKACPTTLEYLETSDSSDIISATKKVLNLIKYCLGLIDLDELLISHKEFKWSDDQDKWYPWPLPITGYGSTYGFNLLDEKSAPAIQQF